MTAEERETYENETILPAILTQMDKMKRSKQEREEAFTHIAKLVRFANITLTKDKDLRKRLRDYIIIVRFHDGLSTTLLKLCNETLEFLNQIDGDNVFALILKNDHANLRAQLYAVKNALTTHGALLYYFFFGSDEMKNVLYLSNFRILNMRQYKTIISLLITDMNYDPDEFTRVVEPLFGIDLDEVIKVFYDNPTVFMYLLDAFENEKDELLNFEKCAECSDHVLWRLIEKKTPITNIQIFLNTLKWMDSEMLEAYMDRITPDMCFNIISSVYGKDLSKILELYIRKGMCMTFETFQHVAIHGTVEDIGALLEVEEFEKHMEHVYPLAPNNIRSILKDEMKKRGIGMWNGWSRGDIEKLDIIFGEEASKWSVCPVCLKYMERKDGCMYMSHDCMKLVGFHHAGLYYKYASGAHENGANENEWGENGENEWGGENGENWNGVRGGARGGAESRITWCTICNRICYDHQHFAISDASSARPHLLHGGNPFDTDCRSSGGGGLPEKIARFRRLREYALELNNDIGEITKTQALEDLVEQMWNAPLYKTRKVQQIEKEKKWNIPSSEFPMNRPNEETNAPNIPRPAANVNLLPVLVDGMNALTLDDAKIVQFIHRRANGSIHHHEEGLSLESLKTFLTSMNKEFGVERFGYCWDSQCSAKLHPDEVQKAFELFGEPNEELVADYRKKWNKKFQGKVGGKTRKRKHRSR